MPCKQPLPGVGSDIQSGFPCTQTCTWACTCEVQQKGAPRFLAPNLPTSFKHTADTVPLLQSFPVPDQIRKDVRLTQDRLPKIAQHASLFSLRLSSDGTEILALGSTAALDTAHVLINMHFVKAPQLAKVGLCMTFRVDFFEAWSIRGPYA